MGSFTELSASLQILCFCFLAWLLYLLFTQVQEKFKERKLLPLPPGPRGKPIIGNLPEVIAASKVGEQHLLFEKWAREYGELYKVKVGPFTQYMVSSDLAVKAIFDKPAGVSANRPSWLVSGQHICNGWYDTISAPSLSCVCADLACSGSQERPLNQRRHTQMEVSTQDHLGQCRQHPTSQRCTTVSPLRNAKVHARGRA